MELVEFTDNDELLLFFRCKKTEMSCMDKPQTFLNQLRDHGFVQEEIYTRVSRMKSKERLQKGIYEILNWVEKKRADDIQLFWKCVFEEVMLSRYQTLKMLHRSFCDGSFRSITKKVDKLGDTNVGNHGLENEKKTSSVKNKKKSVCDDAQEQPGPSSQVTPSKKKKSSKRLLYSPLKKGEKSDMWNWPIYKFQLPVTCGKQRGMLEKEKLAKGKKCIQAKKQWFTPGEFEKFSGKTNSKNWKLSIRCGGTPLGEIIEKGHLKCGRFKRGSRGNKKSLSSHQLMTDSDEEDEDDEMSVDKGFQADSEAEEEDEDEDEEISGENEEPHFTTEKEEDADHHSGGTQNVFNVTSGSLPGKLYKVRFATGYCGKCIRTKTSWMTPKDFAEEGSGQPKVLWKRDIQFEGKPLSDLIEKEILRIHSVQCICPNCKPEDPSHQDNDDECWVCKRGTDGDELLVECDSCPRSFHQKCHLPHVGDSLLRDDANWNCTFCTFESCQDYDAFERVEKSRVMSYQTSAYTLECHYLLLFLCGADEHQLFAADPRVPLTDDSSSIKSPMWMRKVADTLMRNGYQTVGQFVSDVQLIFSNCASYHEGDSDVRAVGDMLRQLFEREFTMAFNIIPSPPTT